MVLFRALGWLLLVLAVAATVQNGLTWWSAGAFHLLTLRDMWARFDYGSLAATQKFFVNHVPGQDWTLGALVGLPAIPVFLIGGQFCLWIGQRSPEEGRRGSRRNEGSFLGGSRRRRRRSGGLS